MSMRLGETIGKFIPEKIYNHIPQRTTSLEQFVELAGNRDGLVIRVDPVVRVAGIAIGTKTNGLVGNFLYTTEYTSYTPKGKKIIFSEVHAKRYGSERDFFESDERETLEARLFITTQARLDDIQNMLSQAEIKGFTQEATTQERERIQSYAMRFSIIPFPKSTDSAAK